LPVDKGDNTEAFGDIAELPPHQFQLYLLLSVFRPESGQVTRD